MLGDDNPLVELSGVLISQSEKAFYIDFGDKKVWIPKSRSEYAMKDTWHVEEWLAKEKGLI